MTDQSPNDQFHASSFPRRPSTKHLERLYEQIADTNSAIDAPAQGWRSGAARRCRRVEWSAAILLTATALFASPATATNGTEDLMATFELCQQLGMDRDVVDRKMTELGWTLTKDPRAPADLLRWLTFARDYAVYTDEGLRVVSGSNNRGEQLGHLVLNADFIAVSILGNSELPKGQPSYQNGTQRLAVLGVSLGRGQCLFGGPEGLVEQATALEDFEASWPDQFTQSNRPGVEATFGETQIGRVAAFVLDGAEITQLYASETIVLPYTSREFDPTIFDDMPEAVVAISPIQQE